LCGLGLGANNPAQSFTYAPVSSSRLRVHFSGPVLAASAVNVGVNLVYGTGTAPGVAGTGGANVPFAQNMGGANSSVFENQYLFGIVSGLAINTLYWFDLSVTTTSPVNVTIGHNAPNSPLIFAFEEF
jgi:hypothetical protein